MADRAQQPFADLWAPRFDLHAGTRFATAGSCFAQRITMDFVGPGRHAVPPDEVWEEGGRYAARDDVLRARAHTLACIRDALPRIDVLVFTLGLAEGWEHVAGYAYPMCPGTVRGRFDADLHRFVNPSNHGVVTRLDATVNQLREARPGMRFLLTVSPVPLTATAARGHVLSATTHAKSVLRSAAGSKARYYRPDPLGGGVDWIHGGEARYDGVLDALLPLIGPAPAEALAA